MCQRLGISVNENSSTEYFANPSESTRMTAVVDQVRAISRDTRLGDEIIRQAMEATQQGRKELESQQTQLARQLNRDHGEVQQLALDQQPNNSIVYRIADVQERIEEAEHNLAKVNRQLLDLGKQEFSTQETKTSPARSCKLEWFELPWRDDP